MLGSPAAPPFDGSTRFCIGFVCTVSHSSCRRCPRQALDPLVAVVASGSTSAMSWSMATISMARASTSLPDWKHMPPERHSTAELVDPE